MNQLFGKLPLWALVCATLFSGGLNDFAMSNELLRPGVLVVAGGGVRQSSDEIWSLLKAKRLDGRPIGIISTASSDPTATSEETAAKLNKSHGEGTAIAIPLTDDKQSAEDPAVVELIQSCGGFYFTGGRQSRTVKTLLGPKGKDSSALAAIRKIHADGGVIGGSSAGAAIMSDPMINGGKSESALLHGTTRPGSGQPGVSIRKGLGFQPGVLYCQHHIERGRFGRLVAALMDNALGYQLGIGVAEDTAMLVNPSTKSGKLIGQRAALICDSSNAKRAPNGEVTGLILHYMDRGDAICFQKNEITPCQSKQAIKPLPANPFEPSPAWTKNKIRDLLYQLARSEDDTELSVIDENFVIKVKKTPQSLAREGTSASTDEWPSFTLTNVAVTILRRD